MYNKRLIIHYISKKIKKLFQAPVVIMYQLPVKIKFEYPYFIGLAYWYLYGFFSNCFSGQSTPCGRVHTTQIVIGQSDTFDHRM